MGQQEPAIENRGFGRYLRKVREDRNLSLDAVEEMTAGYPGRVTKSHLSRIENGQAVPTFPRMFALSQIYGVPISSLAERFEIDLERSMLRPDLVERTYDDLIEKLTNLRMAGRFAEALALCDTVIERSLDLELDETQCNEIRHRRIDALIHLSRYVSAKEACEDSLGSPEMTADQRVVTLQYFAICCYRLKKYSVALIALEKAEQELSLLASPQKLAAYLSTLKGNLLYVTGRLEDAAPAFAEAIEKFEKLPNHFEACLARGNLVSVLIDLGQFGRAKQHLKTVRRQAETHGYDRQLALALSNEAVLAFKSGQLDEAETYCLRSNSIARSREYISLVFRNCYYLWQIAREAGDEGSIKTNERTLRAYLSKVDDCSEVQAYRAHLSGGEE